MQDPRTRRLQDDPDEYDDDFDEDEDEGDEEDDDLDEDDEDEGPGEGGWWVHPVRLTSPAELP